MIKQPIFSNATWLIVICALLCVACSQASTQSAPAPNSNFTVQATSSSAVNPTTQTSPTPQNANKVANSINTNTSLPDVTDKGKVQRVQFARGRTSATFKDAVYQNKDNEYLLDAKAGQTMKVSMKVEANRKSPDADYDVAVQIFKAGEDKPFAELEKNSWQGRLPETIGYIIRVSSMTDNNGYTLKITVR